jgi:hypothetical protein
MSSVKRNCAACSYWIGVAMTLLFLALVLAGNTDLIWRFEHQGFPLSWPCAGAAVLAFLISEYSPAAPSRPGEAEGQSRQFSAALEVAEFEG